MSQENIDSSEELVGGILNALERNQDIISVQKSFINAGYSTSDVANAARKASQMRSFGQSEISRNQGIKKEGSNKLIWIVSISSGIIILAGLFLGLFWDSLF